MAKAQRPSPVKLIVGAISSGEGILIKAKKELKRRFGPIDFQSQVIPFDFTGYYEQEMGTNLLRCFFSFQNLIEPQKLAAIKLYTNRLERRLSKGGKRRSLRSINLDPGYISAAKLVLATCKDFAHRIYLNKGIFAEVTLHFQDGSFRPQPWTYPDYRTKEHTQCFNAIRQTYLRQLQH